MKHVSKISVRKIGVQPSKKDVPELGKHRAVATVIGIVRSYKIGTSEAGNFVKFNGDFEAVRLADSESFRSSRAVFPSSFADPLRDAVDSDTDHIGVQFAAQIDVKGHDSSVGFEWVFSPIGEVSGNADPLAALRVEARKVTLSPAAEKKSKK